MIEEKQKELCPVGRYNRHYVYGFDREKYDSWDEIIDQLENIETEDVALVVHGKWKHVVHAVVDTTGNCSACKNEAVWRTRNSPYKICPHCGAKMDL